MFCKFCGEKIEDNTIFCSKCGAKLTSEEKTDVVSSEIIDTTNSLNENEKPIKKKSDNILNIIQKVVFGCLIAGIVGITLFLGIVLVGLFAYGRVFLFDGYDFTKALSIISIVLMIIGVCGIITKAILYFIFKIEAFPSSTIKRILVIVLAVACLSCSIWGFVDCSNNNHYGGGSSSYWSFYTVYSECSCSSPWAEARSDYLSIDTNPYDYDSDSSNSTTYASKALSAIRAVNTKLSLPSYLYDEMLGTRALDGRQSYSGTKVNVSWRYHPDSGLEVRYTKK
jgi:hypothetical protein